MNPHQRSLEPFLFLYITEKCNLRCTHCYMGERLEHERYMSLDLVKEVLSTARVLYGQYKVYLLGGEPTLHPQFADVLQICKDENYKVVLTSNGAIPQKRWSDLTRDKIDSFSFSLDGGTKESHEAMRGPNTFAPLLKSIDIAVGKGFQTRCIYTVTSENVAYVKDALDLAEARGVEMLSFHYYSPMGRGIGRPEIQIPAEKWMDFCEQLKSESEHRKVQIFYPPSFIKSPEMDELKEAGYPGCTARNMERLAIFPDRRVYLCSAFFDTDLHYGTFKDGQIIPQFAPVTEMTLVGKAPDNCRSCIRSDFCKAGCAVYDHFDRTHPTKDCTGEIIPICPLWTMPAKRQGTQQRHLDLR